MQKINYLLLFILGTAYFSSTSFQLYSQVFTEVASQKGIDVQYLNLGGFGSGVSFFDFDHDGWDDITITMDNDSIKFYKNNQGVFEEIPSFVYGNGKVKQALWVDYNNNGHYDLMVSINEGPYKLYKNDGNFNFTDVSQEAGLAHSISGAYGISFADYNRNGFLDLYVSKYESLLLTGPDSTFERLNQLYRNNGDGTFTNVTLDAGVGNGIQPTFQAIWIDYNLNGWPDLYLINDRIFYGNTLYRNNGDGTFTDVTDSTGTELFGNDPMSTTAADFNNDGLIDIFITNTGDTGKKGMLLKNNGDGTFTESASNYGIDHDHWGWGSVWIDHDNNTFQDLFVATGLPLINPLHEGPNYFFQNINGDTFLIKTDSILIGNDSLTRSYGAAKGDFTNNGFYDIVVQNAEPENAYLWQNSGGNNNWIKITLEGTVSNRMAIGSWIKVFAGGNQYTHYTFCGENYVSQNSQHYIFGLAQYDTVDSVQIVYSLGHTDTYYNLDVNQHYYFKEGETWTVTIDIPSDTIYLCNYDSVVLNIVDSDIVNIVWSNGYEGATLAVKEEGIYWVEAENSFGIESKSDTIYVISVGSSISSQIVNHPTCSDSSNGLISVQIDSIFGDQSFVWSTGDTGNVLDNLTKGIYAYTFSDNSGCTLTDSIELVAPLPLSLHEQVTPAIENEGGTIDLIINGGTPPYQIYLNDSTVEHFPIIDLDAGTYLVKAFDNNDCLITAEVEVDFHVNINELSNSFFVLYPNPISLTPLKIYTNRHYGKMQIQVFNSLGHLVYQNEIMIDKNQVTETRFSPEIAGYYFVFIYNETGSYKFTILSN